MTWGEFKAKMAAAGVKDSDVIAIINFPEGQDPEELLICHGWSSTGGEVEFWVTPDLPLDHVVE